MKSGSDEERGRARSSVPPVPPVFGRRIQRERTRRRWHLQDLGDASGISANTVLRVEAGRDLTLSVAIQLAAALGTTLDALLAEPACVTCDGMPPAGFICAECGRGNQEQQRGETLWTPANR